MNQEPFNEAFRKGTLRLQRLEKIPVVRALESLYATPDGYSLVVDYLEMLRSGASQASSIADPSSRSVTLVRQRAEGGFEFRTGYLNSADPSPVPTEPVPAVRLMDSEGGDGDPDLEPAEPMSHPVTAAGGGGGEPEKRPATSIPKRQPEPPSISVPVSMPTQQPTLGLALASDEASKEQDLRLVHQLLTDYHAGRLRWYEEIIERVKPAHDRQLVLQMLAGDQEHDGEWSDTPMSVGPPLCWAGLPRIKRALPLKARMYFLGRVVGLESPSSARIKVSCEVLVTQAHEEVVRKLPFNASGVMSLRAGSSELCHRVLLFWNRGLVRFKVRLSRGLAIQSHYGAEIEDAYLEGIAEEKLEELIQWTADALRQRPPDEPPWRERSI